ncbi:MAG: hypothetical protein QM820_07785 [Minicystis sp.]
MDNRLNVLSPEVRANPYRTYAALRRERPVCQVDPAGMWAVSRHEDVLSILRRPEIFSSGGFRVAWQPPWVGYNPLANSLIALDPPAHTRLRTLVSRAFGPRSVARLADRVRVLALDLARHLDGEVELVDAFAMPLPAFVISELLGLDHHLETSFKRWGDDILSVTPEPPSPDHAARVRASIDELDGYLGEVIAARRRSPADDTVSDSRPRLGRWSIAH